MSAARAHHFISQCYLKGFTENGSKNSKLFVVGLQERKYFQTKPANVAQRRDFNRVEGRPPGEIEELLAPFEGQAAAALLKLAADRSLDDVDAWLTVLNLVALFAVRHPLHREQVRQFTERIARLTMEMTLATRERWESQVRQATDAGFMDGQSDVTYEQMRDFVQRGEYTVNLANARHLQLEFQLHDAVLETLVDRKWTLWTSTKDVGHFITSDRPVILMNADGRAPTLQRPIGHGMMGTVVCFPVCRELFAVGAFEGQQGVREASAQIVAGLNRLVLAHADREAYGATGREPVEFDGRAVSFMNSLEALSRQGKES